MTACTQGLPLDALVFCCIGDVVLPDENFNILGQQVAQDLKFELYAMSALDIAEGGWCRTFRESLPREPFLLLLEGPGLLDARRPHIPLYA
jgi:hypothetical protein